MANELLLDTGAFVALVGPRWPAQKICLEFLLRGAFLLVPPSAASLKRVSILMEKYRSVPMDYADATLVALGEELGITSISHPLSTLRSTRHRAGSA